VIAQVALSLVLLFGAGLFIRTLVQLQREQLGVDARHMLVVDLDATQNGYTGPRLAALYETILERLQTLPGVQGVTASRLALFSGWVSNGPIAVAGLEAKAGGMTVYWNAVAPSFAETMGLKLRVGRPIGWEDLRAARRVAVINDAAAQYFFGSANPLGRTFTFGAQMKPAEQYEVIGVVQNAKYGSVRGAMPRTAYVPFTAMTATLSGLSFALRTAGDPSAVVPALRRVVRDLDAGLALANVRSETDQIATSLWQERLFADLMTAFGLLAILLASVGIYGTMSYAVARRRREIGLRMAIGAQRGQVLRLILGGAMRLTLIGIVLGVPVTLAASRLVGSELFGVTPADPQTMIAAIVVLVAIMAGAGYWPAYRASRVDPMAALRAD
jgi:predicted permease